MLHLSRPSSYAARAAMNSVLAQENHAVAVEIVEAVAVVAQG